MIWGLMIPSLFQKWLILNNLRQDLFKKFGFFLILSQFSRAGFFDSVLALSNKNSTFVLASGFLAVVFSQFCSNMT